LAPLKVDPSLRHGFRWYITSVSETIHGINVPILQLNNVCSLIQVARTTESNYCKLDETDSTEFDLDKTGSTESGLDETDSTNSYPDKIDSTYSDRDETESIDSEGDKTALNLF